MKKKNVSRMITLLMASAVMLSGCGNTVNEGATAQNAETGETTEISLPLKELFLSG